MPCSSERKSGSRTCSTPRPAKEETFTASQSRCRRSFHFPSAFYDHLSSISLTRGALWEFDSRQRHTEELQQIRPSSRSPWATKTQLIGPEAFCRACSQETRRRLKIYARRGGPDLRSIRGMPPHSTRKSTRHSEAAGVKKRTSGPACQISASATGPGTSSARSKSRGSRSSKSTGPYDANFATYLTDAGVFEGRREAVHGDPLAGEPSNLAELRKRLLQRRPSLSASSYTDSDHMRFVDAVMMSTSENTVVDSILPVVAGNQDVARASSGRHRFTNLDPLSNELPPDMDMADGNPDLWDGVRVRDVDRRVRDELNGLVVPTKQAQLPVVPNFVVAAKGAKGTFLVAQLQALYDGALCTRGMHALSIYCEPPPGNDPCTESLDANVVAAVFLQPANLSLYTFTRRWDRQRQRPHYYMHHIDSYSLSGSRERFVEGATAFRNARDWADQVRRDIIRQVHSRLTSRPDDS